MRYRFLNGLITLVLCFILFLGTSSCSKETKYNTLTIFFDGVPKPGDEQNKASDSIKSSVVATNQRQIPLDLTVFHPPYSDNNCSGCHDRDKGSKLIQSQPGLCYNCHESFETKYKILHGPVESGYCSECHSPHSSEYKLLLVSDKQKLCFKCHAKTDVLKNEVHASIDETLCWDCHNPHGGSDRTFMK